MKALLKNTIWVSMLVATPALLVGCGGGDDEKEEPSAGSLSDITGAIESPSGTVSADTAADVARAFEESAGVPTAGSRDELEPRTAQSDISVGCSVSGDISISADSSGESATFSYNDCCEAADCCLNGDGSTFYDTSGSGSYTYCATASIDYDCGGLASLDYSYCFGADGSLVYSIEVEGETFAVSGSMSNGTGTLTVRGANGSYTCDYTDYSGSCTSDGGDSFTF